MTIYRPFERDIFLDFFMSIVCELAEEICLRGVTQWTPQKEVIDSVVKLLGPHQQSAQPRPSEASTPAEVHSIPSSATLGILQPDEPTTRASISLDFDAGSSSDSDQDAALAVDAARTKFGRPCRV
jgi:hypothetical protein